MLCHIINQVTIFCNDNLRILLIKRIKHFALKFFQKKKKKAGSKSCQRWWSKIKVKKKTQCTWSDFKRHYFLCLPTPITSKSKFYLKKIMIIKSTGRLYKLLLNTYCLEFCILLTDVQLLESFIFQKAWLTAHFYLHITFEPAVR